MNLHHQMTAVIAVTLFQAEARVELQVFIPHGSRLPKTVLYLLIVTDIPKVVTVKQAQDMA